MFYLHNVPIQIIVLWMIGNEMGNLIINIQGYLLFCRIGQSTEQFIGQGPYTEQHIHAVQVGRRAGAVVAHVSYNKLKHSVVYWARRTFFIISL